MKSFFITLALFTLLATSASAQTYKINGVETDNEIVTKQVEQQFYKAINNYRQTLSLRPLSANIQISKIVKTHIDELKMFDIEVFATDTNLRKSAAQKDKGTRQRQCEEMAEAMNLIPASWNEISSIGLPLVFDENKNLLIVETVDYFLKSYLACKLYSEIIKKDYSEKSMVGIKAYLVNNKIILYANFLAIRE